MHCKLCGKVVDKLEDGLCEECKLKRIEYLNNSKNNNNTDNQVQFKIPTKDKSVVITQNKNDDLEDNDYNSCEEKNNLEKSMRIKEIIKHNKKAYLIHVGISFCNFLLFVLWIPTIIIMFYLTSGSENEFSGFLIFIYFLSGAFILNIIVLSIFNNIKKRLKSKLEKIIDSTVM